MGLPVSSPDLLLPQGGDFGGQLLGWPGGIQHDHVASELVTKPGLLSIVILPSADGDSLSDGLARTLPMEILDGFTNADAVETGRVGLVTFGQHRSNFLDQPSTHHVFGPSCNPL